MESDTKDWIFRHYVANSLNFIPQNKYYTTTLYEMVEPQEIDGRTVEEITQEVIEKTGIILLDR